jgi:hypothetical protein
LPCHSRHRQRFGYPLGLGYRSTPHRWSSRLSWSLRRRLSCTMHPWSWPRLRWCMDRRPSWSEDTTDPGIATGDTITATGTAGNDRELGGGPSLSRWQGRAFYLRSGWCKEDVRNVSLHGLPRRTDAALIHRAVLLPHHSHIILQSSCRPYVPIRRLVWIFTTYRRQ